MPHYEGRSTAAVRFSFRRVVVSTFVIAVFGWGGAVRVAVAQSSSSDVMRFYKNGGPQIGINRTTMAPGGSVAISPLYGLVGGVFVFVPIGGSALAFEFEAVVARKGARFSDGTESNTFRATYIEVPLVARITLPGTDRVRPFVTFGPVVATMITDSVNRASSSYDMGISAGGGVISGQLMFAVRYTRGLKGIDLVIDNKNLTNRSVAVTIGYLIR
jgi:hypothetical protein